MIFQSEYIYNVLAWKSFLDYWPYKGDQPVIGYHCIPITPLIQNFNDSYVAIPNKPQDKQSSCRWLKNVGQDILFFSISCIILSYSIQIFFFHIICVRIKYISGY